MHACTHAHSRTSTRPLLPPEVITPRAHVYTDTGKSCVRYLSFSERRRSFALSKHYLLARASLIDCHHFQRVTYVSTIETTMRAVVNLRICAESRGFRSSKRGREPRRVLRINRRVKFGAIILRSILSELHYNAMDMGLLKISP